MPQEARGSFGAPGRSQERAYGVQEGVRVRRLYGFRMEPPGGARWSGLEPVYVLDGPDSSGLSRVRWRRSRDDRRSGTLLRSTIRRIWGDGIVAQCAWFRPPECLWLGAAFIYHPNGRLILFFPDLTRNWLRTTAGPISYFSRKSCTE